MPILKTGSTSPGGPGGRNMQLIALPKPPLTGDRLATVSVTAKASETCFGQYKLN